MGIYAEMRIKDAIQCVFKYSTALLTRRTILRFNKYYYKNLKKILNIAY